MAYHTHWLAINLVGGGIHDPLDHQTYGINTRFNSSAFKPIGIFVHFDIDTFMRSRRSHRRPDRNHNSA
jgi:hypothetical protein